MSKQEETRTTVDHCYAPTSESESTDEDVSIQDEVTRRDVQILTARLYDLRERFMKIVHKINDDAKDFEESTSDEGKHSQNLFSPCNNTVFFSPFSIS